MKKKNFGVLILILLSAGCVINWLGIGYASSGAAIHDLREELQAIYGEEYTGRETENGTEDMTFVIRPRTWFLTNWDLRQAKGLDYQYDCDVVFTRYVKGEPVSVRRIRYRGIDPMGKEHLTDGAYLRTDSKTEIS